MQEGVVALGIEREQTLVEQHVNRLSAGTVDHELGACLTEDCRRVINELPGMCFNT